MRAIRVFLEFVLAVALFCGLGFSNGWAQVEKSQVSRIDLLRKQYSAGNRGETPDEKLRVLGVNEHRSPSLTTSSSTRRHFAEGLIRKPENMSQTLERVMPAVVNIVTHGKASQMKSVGSGPAMNPGSGQPFVSIIGSGVIIDADQGYIATNAHVVQGAKTISVTLSHGKTYQAKCMGVDEESDLALLKIPSRDLTAMALGNSDHLKVGDSVVAIGSPFGLKQTVTSGIISALQRTSFGMERFENFIQTDASINPGNSGGALINRKGELVGINTARLASDVGSVGIGFAIPINIVKSILNQIAQYGAVHRGWVGTLVQDVTPDLIEALKLPKNTKGAIVTWVYEHSPAAKAGLRTGDIIQEVNGQIMHTSGQLKNLTGTARVGDPLKIKFLQNGHAKEVSVQITDPSESDKQAKTKNPFLYGMDLRNFDCVISKHGIIQGVEIVQIDEESLAWQAGLRPGEVILMANQSETKTIEQLQTAAQNAKDSLLVNVISLRGARFVVMSH